MTIGSNNSSSSESNIKVNKNEALVQRIRAILDRTPPSSWEKGGHLLNPNERHEKPRQTWDMVYCTKISAGTLVIRCCTPIRSVFLGKGYQYTPSAPHQFTIEIRSLNWSHKELTDPFKRSESSDKRCDVLANGALAQQIFLYVKSIYDSYYQSRIKEFQEQAPIVIDQIIKLMRDNPDYLGAWDERSEPPFEMKFANVFEDILIEACRFFNGKQEKIYIRLEKDGIETFVNDQSLAKDLLMTVIEQEQSTKLETLTKALEEV